jgi:hypothetical protein
MWAHPSIVPLAPLAIHAEQLEAGRELVPDEPSMHLLAGGNTDLTPVCRTIVVDVINGQEHGLCFTAACTGIAIMTEDCLSDCIPARGIASIDLCLPCSKFAWLHGFQPLPPNAVLL